MNNKVLVIDNGGYTLKVSYVPPTNENVNTIVIPNQVGKTKNEKKYIVGDDLSKYHNSSSDIKYRGPMERGYITNWAVEKEIWDHLFKRDDLKVKPQETSLLLTEAPFDFDEIRRALYETVYEQYKFKSLSLMTPSTLGLYNYKMENASSSFTSSPCQLVVDCGYSFTHVIPHFQNTKLNYAIKRFQIGGKVLTNYLKEIVSFRYWDMMHETRLLNTIKERICFVSQDFINDISTKDKSRQSLLKVDYVLPDYTNNNTTGFIKNKPYFPNDKDENNDNNNNNNNNNNNGDTEMKENNGLTTESSSNSSNDNNDQSKESTETTATEKGEEEEEDEQILSLVNERFSVPELIFNPNDIGLNQAGLAESIVQSINCTDVNLHQSLYSNILLLGGTTKIAGFKQRLFKELRSLAPDNLPVKIYTPEDPILSALYGGIKFAQQPDFNKYTVTKQEYEEYGYPLANKRFY
ncbi:actin related protein 6 [Heterostelium album PN500]|uniref:Actin-related protein 6 n=1 Tax=Heterostelium pallidum (strain ATCC 26659 / Pp 5 / PN500) TaxID=670386 RepID=D3BFQ8_HETP5|nr:actin related protein 6 [Heterostelium album PN500]EFA79972.1 actin related protein 6 [Heterostelium album PN500]|eukprot:XP_020432092.1 actin related protein 6 [Heterostelium album PN500]